MSVNTALEEIIEGGNDKSIIQMFDELSQEIIAYSFSIIKRKKGGGPGMVKEEKEWLDEAQYQLDIINKVVLKLKKSGRLPDDKPNENFTEELREKIKTEMKRPVPQSSVAPIVTMIPVHEELAEKKKNKK